MRIMQHSHLVTPAAVSPVSAGDPSHAYADIEWIDLNAILAYGDCILLNIRGDILSPRIPDGSMAIVDRGKPPQNGDVIVAHTVDGYTVKQFELRSMLRLVPSNGSYPSIEPVDDLSVVGVVRFVITPPIV